ncbi:MAG: Two-component system sensor histidine kinase/response regulator hybrid [uncultured Cytophagales bacterium]|uniref:histidine kinase n=1 Tax=uncultured Cytophagales bacterium TaxID=158755 RepID=A0A6J4KJS8_9SPHI|nr:MAG: Two-component system sensor histidine kinase/response regulator hybrid [uncultured Cytophagales bacterium]
MTPQDVLQELAHGFTTVAIGRAFFLSLARYLSNALEVDYVFIGQLVPAAAGEAAGTDPFGQSVRSEVFFAYGQEAGAVQYPLVGTLCQHVVASGFCAFPSRVQQRFPQNQALKHFGVDSYVGISLYNSSGEESGIIYVMDKEPIKDLAQTEHLLRIVAKRVELELERLLQERQLQEANEKLRNELAHRRQVEDELRESEARLRRSNQALQAAQASLATLNGQLEQRIGQRTAALEAATGQISGLLDREKAARQEAENQRRVVEDLFMQAPVAIAIYRAADFVVELANEAVLQVWGAGGVAVQGRPLFEAIPHLKGLGYQQRLQNVRDTGTPYVGNEIEINRTRNGRPEQLYLNIVHQPLRNAEGAITRIITVAHPVTGLVEARQKVQASEARMQRVLDSMFIFAGLFTAEGRLLYANKAPLQAAGIAIEEVLGKPLEETPWWSHSGEERKLLKEKLQQAASGETVRYEASIVDKAGNRLLLDVTFGPLYDEQGKMVQLVGSAVDVTAQKEVQRQLKQSHERYQALVKNFPNGAVFLVDQQMRYQVVGGSGLAGIGLTEEMLLGKTPQEVFSAPVAGPVADKFRQALAGVSFTFEENYAGRVHQVQTTPVVNESGEIVAGMAITQNVTREKEAREALRFYQFLVDNTDDAIYCISPQENFRLVYVNRAACRHFGLPAEQLLTLSIPDWDPSFTWEDCRWMDAQLREKKRLVFESRHRQDAGEVIPVEVSATLLQYNGKEYYGGYIKDLRERKKNEAALRESEERYRHLFHANKDPLFLLDRETRRITDANPAACQVYGYTREELLGLQNTDISAEPERTLQAMQEQVSSVPLRYHRKKDGTVFPAELAFNHLLINGRPASIVAVRDITERVEASRKLAEEKQRLELALWGADLGTWDWNVAEGTVLFNEKYAQLLGYALDELPPRQETWNRLLHPGDRERVLEELQGHLSGQKPYYQAEHRLRGKSGEWRWMLGSGKVMERDPAGKPLRMVGITQDITSRMQAEMAMQELKLRLEGIITSAMDAIITISDTQHIVMTNQAAQRMFGYGAEALLNQPIDLLIPQRLRSRHQAHVHQYGESGRTTRQMGVNRTLAGLRADGREFPIEASISQVEVTGNKYYTVILRDVTLREEARQQEKKRNEELIRQNAQLQQFAFITSHNLRAPVANLLGLVHIYNAADPADPLNQTVIENIERATQKLDEIIHDLNALLAVREQTHQPLEAVSLAEVFEDVKQSLQLQLQGVNPLLTTAFGVSSLRAIRSYVQSILFNLLSNALKYRSPDRPLAIRLETRREEDHVLLLFSDNGLGIDLEKHGNKLFGLYKRFHTHTEGKGLGLHLVKTQVEAMGGKIEVKSLPGEGTTFILHLKASP